MADLLYTEIDAFIIPGRGAHYKQKSGLSPAFLKKLFVLSLASRFRFLLAPYGRLLIVLSFAHLGKSTGTSAGFLETPQGALQALVIFDSDL
jgi:hypothetical protein